jgi:murein DD-endopeptidase MepM/ murein hydrolase activator NlpD
MEPPEFYILALTPDIPSVRVQPCAEQGSRGERLTDFGWTRLAYLLIVLSVLAALAQLGSAGADPRSLAAEPPDERTVAEVPPAHANGSHQRATPQVSAAPRAGAAPGGGTAAPAFARHPRRDTAGGVSAVSEPGRAVFYRPPPPSPPSLAGAARGAGPNCGDLGRFPGSHRLVFPLPMGYANSYEDTWGVPRPQGGHEGTDLMAPTGTPEYAVTDGTIVPVTGSNGNGWNTLGGYALMLRAAYSVGPVREGDLFYYAHLEKESTLPLGATVRAGQVVGYAGDTGQGPEVTRGLFPPHLHLGWYDAAGARSYLPSGAMNPYPLLEWITAGGGVLGGGSRARYCEVPRSGPPIPSAGEDRWPAARDAGARPDLDTGLERPAPGPVASKAAGTPELQSAHAKQAAPAKPQNRTPGKHPQETTGTASPESRPEADETPNEPVGGEPPPHAAPPAEQSREGGSHPPSSTPENEPAEAEGSDPSDEGREPERGEEKGEEDAANDPGGDGKKPEEEKPEIDPPPPDGGTAPDESEPSSGTGSGEDPETTTPESTVPETGGSEDGDGEQETTSAPPETTTPE